MRRIEISKPEFRNLLKDFGIEAGLQEEILTAFISGKFEKTRRLLLTKRSDLLTDIHTEQEKLYCMDYILRRLHRND